MPGEHAQLSLRRTGGLAGLPMVASLNTRELDSDEADRISGALDQVDLDQIGAGSAEAPGAADTLHYELQVQRGDSTQTVDFGEHQMPAELKPVVRALMDRAKPGD